MTNIYEGIETFDELAQELIWNENTFTDYETLKNFAIDSSSNDNLYLAIHILKALEDDPADYYVYDYSMGTLETPEPMHDMDDLLSYIDSIY